MANQVQLAILGKGNKEWNNWRAEDRNVNVDLSGADLSRANLREANLGWAHLSGADLTEADLRGANLKGANLSGADLIEAKLDSAFLSRANLRRADLTSASLFDATLIEADLSETNLKSADLSRADLSGADLQGSDFSGIRASETIFGNIDLREVIGLNNIEHRSPSTIGTNTFAKSVGKIPEVFLRGCGLSDWEIEEVKLYNPDLSNEEINKTLYKIYDLRASQAIQISPLFISYSHADGAFVDTLENQLNKKGIRFWRDVHDATAGPLEEQIGRAIRLNPTVLLILSQNSIKSDWVEHEVRTARELRKEINRHVLCPVALDDSWKNSLWPKRLTEQVMEYNILDFSAWKDDRKFDGMFRKLIDGLELFYKG